MGCGFLDFYRFCPNATDLKNSLQIIRLEYPMAEKLDKKELVSHEELLMANAIQLDDFTQLLIEKGVLTEEESFAKLKQVQIEYEGKR